VDRSESALIIENVNAKRVAVRSSTWLGVGRQHVSVYPSDQQYQCKEAERNGNGLYANKNISPQFRTVWAEEDEDNMRIERDDEMDTE